MLLQLGMVLTACNPQKSSDMSRGDRGQSSGSTPSSDASKDTDTVATPTPVTGTYLSCAIERLAAEADPQSQLACALVDATTQKKVDLSQRVVNPEFTLTSPEAVRVSRLLLASDPRWHVLFTIRGDSANQANEALKSSQLKFQGTSKDGKNAPLSQKSTASEAVASAKASPPPVANGLYTKIQSLALSSVTSNAQTQYACRGLSTQDNGFHLGRVLGDEQSCSFAFATGSERSETFDYIALPTSPLWLSATNGTIPSTALALGFEGNNSPQYLCRASVSTEGLVFGKIAAGYAGCNIFASSGYIQVASYEILSR